MRACVARSVVRRPPTGRARRDAVGRGVVRGLLQDEALPVAGEVLEEMGSEQGLVAGRVGQRLGLAAVVGQGATAPPGGGIGQVQLPQVVPRCLAGPSPVPPPDRVLPQRRAGAVRSGRCRAAGCIVVGMPVVTPRRDEEGPAAVLDQANEKLDQALLVLASRCPSWTLSRVMPAPGASSPRAAAPRPRAASQGPRVGGWWSSGGCARRLCRRRGVRRGPLRRQSRSDRRRPGSRRRGARPRPRRGRSHPARPMGRAPTPAAPPTRWPACPVRHGVNDLTMAGPVQLALPSAAVSRSAWCWRT